MSTSAKRSRKSISFRFPARVDVSRAEFVPLASLDHLDVATLARAGRAEIEVGYFKGSCCSRHVRAIVRKGMVTDLILEPCSDDKPKAPSAEIARLMNIVRRRMARPGAKPFRPVPVAEFVSRAAGFTIDTITCVRICIFGFCFVCCTTVDPDRLDCGDRVVVVKD